MTNQEILDGIRSLSNQEKRDLTYERLVEIINQLSPDEIIELSNIMWK